MGGGDGGGVERGERIAQPGLRSLRFFVGAREQVLKPVLVVADRRAIISPTVRTIWDRTRSRSSWVAERLNVTSSIWSRVARPSAR